MPHLSRVVTKRQLTQSTFASGTNANAVCIVRPLAGFLVLRSFTWSYSGTPTGGRLLLENPNGQTLLDFDITAGGPGVLVPEVSAFQLGPLVGTLFAGGSGIVGKLTLFTYEIETDGYQLVP